MGLTYRLIVGYEHFSDTDKKKCKVFAQSHIGRPGFYIVLGGVDFYVEANYMMSLLVTYFLSLITSAVETPI